MLMKVSLIRLLFLLVAGVSDYALAQQNQSAAQKLVMQGDGQGGAPCQACHGADGAGIAASGFPALYNLQAGYMVKQMEDYRSGKRASVVMAPAVAKLNRQQLEAVASYYAAQKPAAVMLPPQPAEQQTHGSKLATTGQWQAWIVPCESCHGPGNRGVGNDFPALAGQHPAYLKQQLLAWRDGSRANDPDQLMLAIAARLSPEQIDAVVEYLARLPAIGVQ